MQYAKLKTYENATKYKIKIRWGQVAILVEQNGVGELQENLTWRI